MSSLLERASSLSRHDLAETERVRYMERILAYYVPNLSFDIHSLRRAAEELKNKHRVFDSDAPDTRVELDELEDLAIDDEDFTIKALPDNTTRRFGPCGVCSTYVFVRSSLTRWFQNTLENSPTSTSQ